LREGSHKLISVGNLTPEKGFSYLIEAVNILTDKGLDLQLVIVGKGTERAALNARIRALGLGGSIWLAGGLDNHIVRNLYQHFDLFVLPSYSETFGIVFLEAMDAGLPVLGIEGQGIHGLFEEGREALFAQPRDAASLADRIARFIQEPELAAQLARAGQTRVQKDFMLPGLIGRVREVYERQ
jgi:glycosyltransferase involved in cell wall biosynthesis